MSLRVAQAAVDSGNARRAFEAGLTARGWRDWRSASRRREASLPAPARVRDIPVDPAPAMARIGCSPGDSQPGSLSAPVRRRRCAKSRRRTSPESTVLPPASTSRCGSQVSLARSGSEPAECVAVTPVESSPARHLSAPATAHRLLPKNPGCWRLGWKSSSPDVRTLPSPWCPARGCATARAPERMFFGDYHVAGTAARAASAGPQRPRGGLSCPTFPVARSMACPVAAAPHRGAAVHQARCKQRPSCLKAVSACASCWWARPAA